jgi:hypothetical protein
VPLQVPSGGACVRALHSNTQEAVTISQYLTSFPLITQSNTMTTENNIDKAVEAAAAPFENFDVVQRIVSFVGPNQYRFVAAVNNTFKVAYCSEFPGNKSTYLHVSTVEHAKICFEYSEMKPSDATKLCTSAVRHGCPAALQYLQSRNVPWDQTTSYMAAKLGHLHFLQYLQANGCPWDKEVCSIAALVTLMYCNGLMRMVVHGMKTLAVMLH